MTPAADTPKPHTHDLRGKALAGFFWSYGALLGGRIVYFVATLALARLLLPSDFGLVAFAVAVLSLIDNLADLGVGQALVYRSDGTKRDVASTAFWVGVGGAFATVLIVWALSSLLAGFGPDAGVRTILVVLCLQYPLRSLGSVHRYLAIHALEFKKLTLAEFLSQLVKGAVMVALAVWGAGVWSLVIGQLASTLVWSLTLWVVTGWRPSPIVRVAYVRSLVRFGAGIGFIGIVGYASHNIDYLIVGARLGAEQLGFYTLAFRIPEIAILEIFIVLQGILFPYFSRLKDAPAGPQSAQDEVDRLASSYRQTLRTGSILSFPLGLGMASLALPLVLVLYGDQWRPSAVPLALVAVWSAFSALAGLPATTFKSLGRAGLLTSLATVEIGLTAPTLWLIAPRGINAVAAALVAVKLTYMSVQAVVVRRVVGVPCLTQAGDIVRGLGAAMVMAAVVYPIGRAAAPPVALAVGVPVGALVYLGVLRAFFPDDLRFILRLVPERVRLRRRRPRISTSGSLEGGDAG